MLFKSGDRKLGIEQLAYCAENAVFLRVEAKFFLSLLYLNYESDLSSASEHAAKLYREFPMNSYYVGKYLEILLYNKKFFIAPVIIEKLKNWKDPFSQMQYYLYHAYYLEKSEKNFEKAKDEYMKALEISEQFGYYTRPYNAVAYMGLSRFYSRKGNASLANRFFRQAKSCTSYAYILADR
jgi:tetratricopeptide (TPR) repeat protein